MSAPPSSTPKRGARRRQPASPAENAGPRRTSLQPRRFEVSLGLASALYFVLALVYFAKALLPGRLVYGTDYLAGGYITYDFAARQIGSGELPSWIPHIFGGLPFFANPGSTFHPIHLLASLLLPTAKVLPVVLTAQVTAAGIGSYLLARELGARTWVAFVGGLSYEFTGVVLSWVYAGHDGRIIVATLAPLVLALLHMGLRTGRVPFFAGAGAALGVALLSFQIQNAWYLLVSATALAIFTLFRSRRELGRRELVRRAGLATLAVGIGFALAAINFLPFSSYVAASPRGGDDGRGYAYATSFSSTPGDLLGMAVPEQVGSSVTDPASGEAMFPTYTGPNGFKLHTEYVGALALLLLFAGAWCARGDPYWRFFAVLAAFALSMALGKSTPLYQLYHAVLPGLHRFRAPDLAFYIAALSLNVMGAITLERLARLRNDARANDVKALNPFFAIAGALVVGALAGALWAPSRAVPAPAAPGVSSAMGWIRFAIATGALGAVLGSWLLRRLGPRHTAAALAVVVVLDTWSIGRRFFFLAPPAVASLASDEVVHFLQKQPQPSRTWVLPIPAPYRAGSSFLMHFGIEQVGGEHAVPLQRYLEVFGTSKQQRVDWHNVIAGSALVEDRNHVPGLELQLRRSLLDAASVQWIVSRIPLDAPGLREAFRGDHAIIYENPTAMKRAYLVPNVAPVSNKEASLERMLGSDFDPAGIAYIEARSAFGIDGSATRGWTDVKESAPSRVVVETEADGPALLVLADNHYEDWKAFVDGAEVPIVYANHTFRGVPLSAGAHRVVFELRSGSLRLGLAISVATALALAGYGAWLLRETRRTRARRREPA